MLAFNCLIEAYMKIKATSILLLQVTVHLIQKLPSDLVKAFEGLDPQIRCTVKCVQQKNAKDSLVLETTLVNSSSRSEAVCLCIRQQSTSSSEVKIEEFWAKVEKSDSYPMCEQLWWKLLLLCHRTEGRRSSHQENSGHPWVSAPWVQLWEHNSIIIGKMIESHMKYVNLHVSRVTFETRKWTASRRRTYI